MAKFYNDIDVKNNVIKNCDNFVEIKEYTEEEIASLFDMTPQEVEELISILNDNIISNSKIWSSKKIDDEIKLAITKSNKYTDSILNKISSISLMYVSSLPTTDIKDNIIYILKSADGSSNDSLNIYDSTNSTWTTIGKFTISMENYVEKTTYDTDMNLKANKDEVIHYNDIKTDLTSTTLTNTEVIGALSLKTELDKKVGSDKISHVSKYICADSPIINDTMYRLYGGGDNIRFQKFINFGTSSKSIEWDYNLFNKDYGLCSQVLGEGKDLNDLHMNCFFTANNKCLNTPDANKNFFGISLCHTGVNIYSTQICVYANDNQTTTKKRTIYVRDGYNGGWGDWRTISTTGVADVPKTNIAPADETKFIGFKGNSMCNYCVVNGVCYVSLWSVQVSVTGRCNTGVILPMPKSGFFGGGYLTGGGDAEPHAYAHTIPETGELKFNVKDANTLLYGSFSYPIAES